ncbi:uncharacterized protein LOC112575985 [Pomacea canaliculata]|uniref:uncharacterized protein LOC112575985 n=1 Tax=Pomacea canaliculata TaxID=400727 RepID=UPI000D72658E|nr:uncharacterized protein LOC112575985 [Pomacea canaliculata]XP_025113967.1 uncharacterized protein LOC112575985 [Pomacea canaliculata]
MARIPPGNRVPEFSTRAFAVLLRHSAGEARLPLDDDNVWEVLRMSDMYIVPSLVDICFHYLLHCHKSRKRSSHICQALEWSHAGCTGSNYARCLQVAKRRARRIFQNEPAVRFVLRVHVDSGQGRRPDRGRRASGLPGCSHVGEGAVPVGHAQPEAVAGGSTRPHTSRALPGHGASEVGETSGQTLR